MWLELLVSMYILLYLQCTVYFESSIFINGKFSSMLVE